MFGQRPYALLLFTAFVASSYGSETKEDKRQPHTVEIFRPAAPVELLERASSWWSQNPNERYPSEDDLSLLLQYLEKRNTELIDGEDGERNIRSPLGTMRFGKRSPLGTMRFGKRALPLAANNKRNNPLGTMRFGKRNPLGTMRFGKRSNEEVAS